MPTQQLYATEDPPSLLVDEWNLHLQARASSGKRTHRFSLNAISRPSLAAPASSVVFQDPSWIFGPWLSFIEREEEPIVAVKKGSRGFENAEPRDTEARTGNGLRRRSSGTVLSFRNRFITVCASPQPRTLFEALGISHDCRAFPFS